MSKDMTLARSIFEDAVLAHQRFADSHLAGVLAASDVIRRAFAAGRKVLAFGNGGSAADAQHLVAELVGRFEVERGGLPAVALTTDTSVLTAVANDYGYAAVFVRQVEALGRPGDVAVGISTSGRSPNVQAALEAARSHGLATIAFTGRDGGSMGAVVDIHINVPVQSTARVQEVHRTAMHALCALIDAGATLDGPEAGRDAN